VRQRAFNDLPWEVLVDRFDEVTAAGYSVSVFTRWGEAVDQVWVKRRVTGDPEPEAGSFFGATPATVEQHPIRGIDPANCTPQLGVPGRWSDRLPHFRMGFMPSSGEELQSEFFVPRRDAAGAIGALRALAGVVRPVLQVSELRTVAADELWMSPQYRRAPVRAPGRLRPTGGTARPARGVRQPLAAHPGARRLIGPAQPSRRWRARVRRVARP
jgi:xylitol oxidase